MSKVGYTEKEKVQVKLAFIQILVRMKLNLAQLELVNGFFEYYLKLAEKEKTVRKSLEENIDVYTIAKITELSVERIQEIKKNNVISS